MTAACKTRVAILGGSGYTAVELIKLLLRHPHVEIVAVTSRDQKPVSEYHPSLHGRIDLLCEPFDADAMVSHRVEVAFGCLPHGESKKVVGPLLDRGIRVIDLSADYRLRNPDVYSEWYGEPHEDLENLQHAVYGLPELNRGQIQSARLVANPGCYPQTAILSLAPLITAKAIKLSDIIINSLSGVSGAGRAPKLATHFPECNESVTAYNVGKHRHTPEIEQALSGVAGHAVEVLFTPHLIPMDRGILSTIYANPSQAVSEAELYDIARRYFQDQPFVRVKNALPSTKETLHTNYLDVAYRMVRGKVVVFAAEDNLIRGASGVAVQNMNLMFGYPEIMGLT